MRSSLLVLLLAACTKDPGPEQAAPDDLDGDGYPAANDCDDGDGGVHPGATERCNGKDDDCDRLADENVVVTFHPDGDGDGYGTTEGTAYAGCDAPAGYADNEDDCDDADAAIHPGAAEECNGVDDDCDGVTDNEVGAYYTDADGDGYGDPATAEETCFPTESQVADATDCDDGDAAVNPGAEEACDGDDDDCDGVADAGEVVRWYADADGDGFGYAPAWVESCAPGEGYVLDATDCSPFDAEAYPGAAERCNGADDDCDALDDEDFDADQDGYYTSGCYDGDDCDDAAADVHPDAEDSCEDGLDADCDGEDPHCGYWGDIDLADADVKAYGTGSDDFGRQLAVGDATGDGIDDVLGATLYASSYSGGGYLLSEPPDGVAYAGDVGFHIEGSSATYGAGRSIGLGDVDGDGIADAGFGAPYGTGNGMYIALGPFTGDVSILDSDVSLIARTGTYAGHGADVGDVNGDGVADAVIGAYNDSTGGAGAGAVHVEYGPLSGETDLAEDEDAILIGESPGYYTGRWIRAGGDYDGDGVGDILAAAVYASIAGPQSGAVYMVHGGVTGEFDLGSADGRYYGTTPSEYAGVGIGWGDVDGDGLDDVLVGSYDSTGGMSAGAAHVILGPAAGDTPLTSADIIVYGDAVSQQAGSALDAGDVEGDGGGDLLVGGPGASSGGQAWLFFGPSVGTYTVADADATFIGEGGLQDTTGTAVAFADLDGDSLLEVVLGAPGESTGGMNAGAVYVVYPGR